MEREFNLFELIKPFMSAAEDHEYVDVHLQFMALDAIRLKQALENNPKLKSLLENIKVVLETDDANHDLMIS
jgi:hypothetical protein